MALTSSMLFSSVGKKLLNAVSGLTLLGFILAHLIGNLTLLTGNSDAFNAYGHFLIHKTGVLLYVFEYGLIVFFLLHIITAVSVWWDQQVARPTSYKKTASGGDTSKKTLSSTTMIYTGALILVFAIMHLITFKYGPAEAQGYTTIVDGVEMRDLYRLSIEVFLKPGYLIWYIIANALLGLHIRHGFWSAFQSLGLNHPRCTPILYKLGIVVALIMGFGFVVIPAYIYFKGGVL
ncbi:MAG: succinate dehydrogenase cytochrome b subunit [candidate division Zixibacteria bacterium]|nr:succinate dehydrogenase cytochrome b subunit [candidate division Zixibacteria bacterium]